MIRSLDERTLVSGQIQPADVPRLKESGVTMIVNNRPDGEEDGQPRAADIEAAAEQAGIAYCHIPIVRGIGPADVESMQEAMESAPPGKLFVFCRTGNRSTLAWAVARRGQGASIEELERAAAGAGIDLSPVSHLL